MMGAEIYRSGHNSGHNRGRRRQRSGPVERGRLDPVGASSRCPLTTATLGRGEPRETEVLSTAYESLVVFGLAR